MGSLLISQEFLLIFHATVLSPKHMAGQQLGSSAEDAFRREKLSVDMKTCLRISRELFCLHPLQKKKLCIRNLLPGFFDKCLIVCTDQTLNHIN